jgi:transposase
VPKNHPVRVVNEVIDRIDISSLKASCKGGGTSTYHQRMLLNVMVYGYLRNIYSSRKLEQAVNENVHFMWQAGGAKPDHNTRSRTFDLKDYVSSEEDIQPGGDAAGRGRGVYR